MKKFSASRFLHDENGIAAIETAMIMPFLLFLYVGMIDLTALISVNRKVTQATSVVADLISQNQTDVLKSEVNNFFKGVDLVMKLDGTLPAGADVAGYRIVAGSVQKVWSVTKDAGAGCPGTVSTTGLATLMTQGNDIVVARVCTTFEPYVGIVLGREILGAVSFDVTEEVKTRPRVTPTLTCWRTAKGGPLCP